MIETVSGDDGPLLIQVNGWPPLEMAAAFTFCFLVAMMCSTLDRCSSSNDRNLVGDDGPRLTDEDIDGNISGHSSDWTPYAPSHPQRGPQQLRRVIAIA
jgi:hypothetical protein